MTAFTCCVPPTRSTTIPPLPSAATQETREKRRKVLEEVRTRRKIMYTRFRKKMQQLANRQ